MGRGLQVQLIELQAAWRIGRLHAVGQPEHESRQAADAQVHRSHGAVALCITVVHIGLPALAGGAARPLRRRQSAVGGEDAKTPGAAVGTAPGGREEEGVVHAEACAPSECQKWQVSWTALTQDRGRSRRPMKPDRTGQTSPSSADHGRDPFGTGPEWYGWPPAPSPDQAPCRASGDTTRGFS